MRGFSDYNGRYNKTKGTCEFCGKAFGGGVEVVVNKYVNDGRGTPAAGRAKRSDHSESQQMECDSSTAASLK